MPVLLIGQDRQKFQAYHEDIAVSLNGGSNRQIAPSSNKDPSLRKEAPIMLGGFSFGAGLAEGGIIP